MNRSILQPFSTTYSLRVGGVVIRMKEGTSKRWALHVAQRQANKMFLQVWVIEHDEGLRDFSTIVVPNLPEWDGERG
jgi:hypothetical protein